MSEYKLNHIEQTYLPSSSRHVKRFMKSRDTFIKLLDSNGYRLASQYLGVDNHVTVICPEGHEWNTCCFTSFKVNVRCRVCAKQSPETTKKEFYDGLEKEGYHLLTEYVNAIDNVSVICPNGHHWTTCSPSRFNQGVRCRICDGQDSEQAKLRFEKLLIERGDKNLSEYESAKKKVFIQYGKCGHIVNTVTPDKYRYRPHCPICSNQQKESHLATFTKESASRMFSNVELEYKVLKNQDTQYYLPFDIYIQSTNTLIEVHGQQHYEFSNLFHKNEQDFIYRQKLDGIKKEWAITNGYHFIEIDIRDNNEETVIEILKQLKNMEEYNKWQLIY